MPSSTPVNAWPYPLESDTPDVAADIKALALALDKLSPFQAGDIKVSAAATAPTGWLSCDGSAVSRSTFATLFAATGTTYGAGDGSTTFNIPDFRGRTIIGAGTGSGLTARSRGQTVGEETHQLSLLEIPDHVHDSVSSGGNVPAITSAANWLVLPAPAPGGGPPSYLLLPSGVGLVNPSGNSVTSIMTNAAGLSNGTGTVGVSNAHNNMQPSGVANVFIKT